MNFMVSSREEMPFGVSGAIMEALPETKKKKKNCHGGSAKGDKGRKISVELESMLGNDSLNLRW
jgi:hypothetical protein